MLGIFRKLPQGGGRLVPVDKKALGRGELTILPHGMGDAQDGELVAADVGKQGRFGLPVAHVKERFGSLKGERAVSLIAIHAHGIPHVFAREAMAEAEAAQPAGLSKREDWRKIPLVTIDPVDAKDHDDAVFAEADTDPNNRGGFIATVAIADVAHYVTPGSALDREALERGNSVYFPDRVVPMLPERISNDLCSLKPAVDRAALAVRMVIGADGRKRSHTFHRVLMKSAAKLNYQQAQDAIDGRPDDHDRPPARSGSASRSTTPISRSRRRATSAGRSIWICPSGKSCSSPTATVDRVIVPQRLDAHRLIEEFMILANVAAAETLERASTPLIYRVHDEPARERVEALREFLHTLEIPFTRGGNLRPEQFNTVLARIKGKPAENLVNEVVLRTQAQAEYSADNYGHFGLALAPLRAFHLADPPLCRPDRASRADSRAQSSATAACPPMPIWPRLSRNRRPHLHGRTPRHGRRARNHRPPDRAFPGRPDRGDIRGTHIRCDSRGALREA